MSSGIARVAPRALPTWPFAAELKTATQSTPLPVALIALVDARIPAAKARALQAALLKMGTAGAQADTLAQLHVQGFVMPDLPPPAAPP